MARTARTLPGLSVEKAPVAEQKPVAAPPGPPDSLTDVAYRHIKAAIVNGSLPPSLLASEQQIASRLGMSRTPVHQAMSRLEQDGWIRMLPRRGLQIAPISPTDMYDVYETLLALEVTAVGRMAARQRAADDATLVQFEQACSEGEDALRRGDLQAWADADSRFHTLLIESCGNAHLARLGRSVLEHAQRARQITLKLRPRPVSSNEDHRAILLDIRKGDVAGARARMHAHRSRGMDVLLPILEAMAMRPTFLDGS